MKHLPDNIIVEIIKNLEVKDALVLNEALDNRFEPLPERLWEFYLNRDFPNVAQPLNRDFEQTYREVETHLQYAMTHLPRLINKIVRHFAKSTDIRDVRVVTAILDVQKEINNIDLIKMYTTLDLSRLRARCFSAISSDKLICEYSETPLTLSINDQRFDHVTLLFESGVNTKLYSRESFDAIACCDEVAMEKILIKCGVDLNQKTRFGETVLIHAAIINNIEMIKLLLSAGANPEISKDNGHTALTIAKLQKNHEAIAVLNFHTVKPVLHMSKEERAVHMHQWPKQTVKDEQVKKESTVSRQKIERG